MTRPRDPDPQRLIDAHAVANDFYRGLIQNELRALKYLRSRGIVAATAHAPPWTLGYAPRGWTDLRDHLREAKYTDTEMLAAGLVTTASNGNLIDVFRDRVTFPIRNPDGDIVAFTGRDLSGKATTPKYRNTTTTAIYSKKHTLYGLAEQLGGDTQPATVMLVEGTADVIAIARLHQPVGADEYRQPYVAVAPCGTALTAEQVALLVDAVPPGTPLVVAFDPDTAGHAAIERSYELLSGWPGPVDAVALPDGNDPAALVAHGRTAAVQILEQARQPLVDLLIDQRLDHYRIDEIPGRLHALQAVAPLIADVTGRDTDHAGRLTTNLVVRLDLDFTTVYEAVFPQNDDPTSDEPVASEPVPAGTETTPAAEPSVAAADPMLDVPEQRVGTPLGGAGFPDPDMVGHQYARTCPPAAPAATWVEHDPTTGHTAWVLAEGVTDSPGDRHAAQLAAEVAGRVAVIVGAKTAVQIARTAVNAHFTQPGVARADAAITVLTSFDGDQPVAGQRPFTVAWAGDVKAYGSTGRWFAPLTAEHTLRGEGHRHDPATPPVAGDGALTASVRAGAVGVNRIDVSLNQISLVGRVFAAAAPDVIRRAVEWRTPANAVDGLARHGGASTAALVIRPRPDRVGHAGNAARLAQQDKAAAASNPAPGPPASQARHTRPVKPDGRQLHR